MAVSAPPKKKSNATPTESVVKSREKKIDEIINRGSSIVAKPDTQVPDKVKNFNLKILASQLRTIESLRAFRPRKALSPKLGISLQDWILEAIDEKISREKVRYEKKQK